MPELNHISNVSEIDQQTKPQPKDDDDTIYVSDLKILPRSWKVFRNHKEIRFPNREFELLLFLASHPNVVFSKEELFEKIWGYDYTGDSATVTVHIGRIREKIEENLPGPHH